MYESVSRLSHVCSPFASRTFSTIRMGGSLEVEDDDCDRDGGMEVNVILAVFKALLNGELYIV